MVISDDNPLPVDVFKDKIVFVGLTLGSRTGLSQRKAFVTPFDAMTFGTEIHATAASNLLSRDWIGRISARGELIVQALVAALFCLLLLGVSGPLLLFYLAGCGVGALAVQYLAFLLGMFIPVVAPVAFGMFCGILFRILLGNSSAGAKWRV
jgi:CHASE2 domain-containing sensor protein